MMDPDIVIRRWLIGCGRYFGARQAHPYRWPDPSTRPEVPYFTYRPVSGMPDTKNSQIAKHTKSGDYDVDSAYQQHWTAAYQIDLYNAPSGFADLAGCAIAAGAEQTYLNLFNLNNAGFHGVESLDDLTEYDGDRIYYHHRMVVTVHTWMVYEHKNINHVVDEVVLDNPFGTE